MTVRTKGGVVNTVVANATARTSIERSYEEHLKCIDLQNSSWTKSLFQRMGLVKRTCTTWKPEIPEKAKNEANLLFQHQTVNYVEQYSISPSLILNFDQTPVNYAPVASRTLSPKGSKYVSIASSSFKQAITATFGITYGNNFLPMHLIYKGKSDRSLPRVKYHGSFSLSTNEKHISNTHESLKSLDEVRIPYVEKERQNLQLPNDQPALLINDVFPVR